MKEKLKKYWTDPVWSKVIASAIWAVVIGLGSLLYFLFQYINNNFSFSATMETIKQFLSKKNEYTNLHVLLFALVALILAINNKILKGVLSMFFYDKYTKKIDFIFCRQVNDDHYLPFTFSLRRSLIRIQIKPSDNTNYWRFGFNLSHNYKIPQTPRMKNLPLIHLSKNSSDNTLYITRYNEQNQLVDNTDIPIFTNYINQAIKIFMEFKDGNLVIKFFTIQDELLYEEKFFGYDYAQCFAWGDSNAFELKSTVIENT